MMKFKDKDGKVFNLKNGVDKFCDGRDCDDCPLWGPTDGVSCIVWTLDHPAEAARLMGYEVVEDDEEIRRQLKRFDIKPPRPLKETNMAKQKPRFTEEEVADAPTWPVCQAERDRGRCGMNRAEILDAAKRCVCGEREQDYGTPENNFGTIANLWAAYLQGCGVELDFLEEHDVAAMLALVKIARIATGHAKADNWIDLAGYAACGGELDGGGGE